MVINSRINLFTTVVMFFIAANAKAYGPDLEQKAAFASIWCEVNLGRLFPKGGAHTHQDTQPVFGRSAREGPDLALALSGGGYRAMLFHVGTLRRLNDSGLLPRLRIVSSVSGGSITAAFLASRWKKLRFDENGKVDRRVFEAIIEEPLRKLADTTLDIASVSVGLLPLTTVAQQQVQQLDTILFDSIKLSAIASEETEISGVPSKGYHPAPRPAFIINATSLQTGERWQFHGTAMGGPQTHWTDPGETLLSEAVAASSGFPPVLSPVRIDVKKNEGVPVEWHDCNSFEHNPYGIDQRIEPGKAIPRDDLSSYRDSIYLVDGGVRDNLGLAPIVQINRLRQLRRSPKGFLVTLVSDGGQSYDLDPAPSAFWPSQLLRIVGIAMSEPDELRVEGLIRSGQDTIDAVLQWQEEQKSFVTNPLECIKEKVPPAYQQAHRILASQQYKPLFAYWSIRRMPKHHVGFDCPGTDTWIRQEDVRELSRIPTRLRRLSETQQKRLINWGYLSAPHGLPYIPLFWNPQVQSILNTCDLPHEDVGIGSAAPTARLCLLMNGGKPVSNDKD